MIPERDYERIHNEYIEVRNRALVTIGKIAIVFGTAASAAAYFSFGNQGPEAREQPAANQQVAAAYCANRVQEIRQKYDILMDPEEIALCRKDALNLINEMNQENGLKPGITPHP